jgi:hypothetical protein
MANVEGGLLYWELCKLHIHVKEGFGNGATLYLPYKGSVRVTWRKGSFTEDSDRPVIEGTGNGAFHL